MRHALPLALVAALSLGCGRPLLGAEAEIEKVTITTDPIAIPDVFVLGTIAAGLDPIEVSSTISLDYDIGDIPTDKKGVTSSLWLTGFALHLHSTAPRKPDGLREVDVMLVDPQTAATALVAQYSSGGRPNPMDMVFAVPGTDLLPYVRSKKFSARLKVVYDLATLPNAFEAQTELSFAAKVTVDYLDLL